MTPTDFTHPCKGTCSGYSQGHTEGGREALEMALPLLICADDMRMEISANGGSYAETAYLKALAKFEAWRDGK